MVRAPSLTVRAGGMRAPSGRVSAVPSAPLTTALVWDDRSLRGLARGRRRDRVGRSFVAVRDERCPWSSQAAEHGVVGRQVGVAIGVGTTIIASGRPLVLA